MYPYNIGVRDRCNPWMNKTILEQRYSRDHTHKKWHMTRANQWFVKYKKIRNNVTSLIK